MNKTNSLYLLSYRTPKDIIMQHRKKLNISNDRQHIVVRRKHILQDALAAFKRGVDFHSRPRITFVGEPAIDAGGPLREFFRLLISSIVSNGSLFEGEDDSKVPRHNMVSFEDGTFKHIGQMMAMSLIHGGPGPQCLSGAVVDYLTNGNILEESMLVCETYPDVTVKGRLAMASDLPMYALYTFTQCVHNDTFFVLNSLHTVGG